MTTEIGKARNQKVFAVQETVSGTLAFPTTAASFCILPAGNAIINQTPTYMDSEELKNSLDVVDQFENATPPGEFTLPTYIRVCSAGSDPQADAVIQSLMGDNKTQSASETEYAQALTSKSFSLWVQTDHFVQALSGCSANQAVLDVSNDGAVKMEFTGQGMRMYWAGLGTVLTAVNSGATRVHVPDADRFSVGSHICFQHAASSETFATPTSDGYTIVTASGVTLSFTPAAYATIAVTANIVRGYLPAIVSLGDVLKGKFTSVRIGGVSAVMKNTQLTIGCPKSYITDEVGTEYPSKFVEDTRDINSTLSVYFTQQNARYFGEGKVGNPSSVVLTFRSVTSTSTGKKLEVNMPRVRLQVPTINFAAPVVELSMGMKILGTNGEDSMTMTFATF